MRISDWSSDVCSSDLARQVGYRLGLLAENLAAQILEVLHVDGGDVERGEIVDLGKGLRVAERVVDCDRPGPEPLQQILRSEEHTSELQSLMRTSYAVSCLTKKNTKKHILIKPTT